MHTYLHECALTSSSKPGNDPKRPNQHSQQCTQASGNHMHGGRRLCLLQTQ